MRLFALATALCAVIGSSHAAENINLGQTIKASLTTSDRISDTGGRSKDYQLSLKKGQLVALNARSTAIDPILILFNSDGTVLEENDDHGDGTDSLIVTTIPENGTYLLRLNSLKSDGGDYKATGEYTLRAMLVSD